MKLATKRINYLGLFFGLLLTSQVALSDTAHYLGLSYVSGAPDVWDWHEDNLYLENDGGGVPLGLSYRFANISDSGLRFDMGVGPVVLILGDVEYQDIPIQFSLGYNLFKSDSLTTYARAGASLHISDGDYLKEEADYGGVVAVGLESGSGSTKFFIELMYDTAEATFSTAENSTYLVRNASEEDIEVNGFQLTLGARF
jgi:hypothetical protein